MTALQLHTSGHTHPTVTTVVGSLTARTTPALHTHLRRRLAYTVDDTVVLLDLNGCTCLDLDGPARTRRRP